MLTYPHLVSPISLCAAQSVSAAPQRLIEAEQFMAEQFMAEQFMAEPRSPPNHVFVNAAPGRISRLTAQSIGS